jgi:nucleotide-binding universal stress UspA family protein
MRFATIAKTGDSWMSRFKQILVPIDFSAHSIAAFELAVEIARMFHSRIHLLHCYQIQPGGLSPYGIAIPSSYFSEIHAAASRQLADWQAKHVPAGMPVDASTLSEAPSEAILTTAKEIGADLIVMGTRGLSGFKHVMLGSVAERTVRLAACPVMTVHAPETKTAGGGDGPPSNRGLS